MSFEKSQLDTMLNKHYNYLLVVANRIVQADRKHPKEHYDLVASTTELVYIKQAQGKPYIKTAVQEDEDFIKFFSKAMKNMKRWQRSNYNLSNQPTGNVFCIDHDPEDYEQQHEIELGAESTDDENKEWARELRRGSIPTKRAEQYVKIMDIKKTLSLSDKVLFNQAFEEGKSGRLIAREATAQSGMKVPHEHICSMINKLKLKITSQL